MKRFLLRHGWWLLAAGFVLLNVVAYRHAWRMTHFVPAGTRTQSPQRLRWWARVQVLFTGVTVPKPVNDRAPAVIGPTNRTLTVSTRDGVRLELGDVAGAGGTAPGVAVFFAGYAVTKSAVYGEAQAFHELGYRTVLADFRGTGGSEGSDCTLGWHEALDVVAVVDWARREYPGQRLVLYGQSMGAAAALRAIAIEGIRPDALVLDKPFDRLLTTVGHRYTAMGLPSFPFARLLLFWGGRQHGFDAFSLNPAEYARAVTCPTLVLAGDRDPWVTVAEAQTVAAAIGAPTRFHVFPGQAHAAYVWQAPEEYRRVVREWLGTLAAGAVPQ